MKKKSSSNRNLDSHLDDLEARQRNVLWPDVLRGGRAVDEYLWKGAKDAPFVQRVGAVILALAYVIVGISFIAISIEQGSWFTAVFAFLLFLVGGKLIHSAVRR